MDPEVQDLALYHFRHINSNRSSAVRVTPPCCSRLFVKTALAVPDTPLEIAEAPFPIVQVVPRLLDCLSVSTCCHLVRINSRTYASAVLTIKIKVREATQLSQRIALDKVLRKRENARIIAEFNN